MLEEEIKKSFQTLKTRYGNDSFLQKAALRRTHLNYDRTYFGKLNGQKNYLRALLPQAHAAYYIGSFHACIELGGSMLEALLQMKIREELKKYLPPALFMDLCNIKEIRNHPLHYRISRFIEEKDKFNYNTKRKAGHLNYSR